MKERDNRSIFARAEVVKRAAAGGPTPNPAISASSLSVSQVSQESQSSSLSSSSRISVLPGAALPRARDKLLEQIKDKARAAARQMADSFRNHTVEYWQITFHLCRKFKSITGATELFKTDPSAFRPAVDIFSAELLDRLSGDGPGPDGRWVEFLAKWDEVETAEGSDTLSVAMQEAVKHPVSVDLPPHLSNTDAPFICSLASHLSKKQEVFCLPDKRIAKFQGKRWEEIRDLKKLLRKEGFIVQVNEANYKEHRAAEFKLGPAFYSYQRRPEEQRFRGQLQSLFAEELEFRRLQARSKKRD